jgi:hypothetical protein
VASYHTDVSNSSSVDYSVDYRNEMEHIDNRSGDFAKANHDEKMQVIYKATKENQKEKIDL